MVVFRPHDAGVIVYGRMLSVEIARVIIYSFPADEGSESEALPLPVFLLRPFLQYRPFHIVRRPASYFVLDSFHF